MLDFANRPPRSPEDIDLSASGKFILTEASRDGSWETLDALGRAACSELFDALEGTVTPGTKEFNNFSRTVFDKAMEILEPNAHPFIDGMYTATLTFHNNPNEVIAA